MNELEEAANKELISNYVQIRGNEWLYDQNAMLNMFRKGAQWQQTNAWHPIADFDFTNAPEEYLLRYINDDGEVKVVQGDYYDTFISDETGVPIYNITHFMPIQGPYKKIEYHKPMLELRKGRFKALIKSR